MSSLDGGLKLQEGDKLDCMHPLCETRRTWIPWILIFDTYIPPTFTITALLISCWFITRMGVVTLVHMFMIVFCALKEWIHDSSLQYP